MAFQPETNLSDRAAGYEAPLNRAWTASEKQLVREFQLEAKGQAPGLGDHLYTQVYQQSYRVVGCVVTTSWISALYSRYQLPTPSRFLSVNLTPSLAYSKLVKSVTLVRPPYGGQAVMRNAGSIF